MLDLVLAASGPPSTFLYACVGLALVMLIWDTIEVGRNDGANLVNAVSGARILTREKAVWVAGVGVVLGAAMSSQVIDTARKGIFEPTQLTLIAAFAVYTSVYIVDTVLLYGYSAFGMPVSTTACLVFELLGASFVIGGFEIVYWDKASIVILGIVCSILISGFAGFGIQRALRGAIGDKGQQLTTLLLHGGWAGGGMLAGLSFFMLVKGMKHLAWVKAFNENIVDQYGAATVVFILWAGFAILIHLLLVLFGRRAARWLFPGLAIIGTVCMGFAFGQNDLANCASPGLAAWNLWEYRNVVDPVSHATRIPVKPWMLLGCGVLLLGGMTTRNAQRVTRAAVHTGSQSHSVELWAPRWCIRLARTLVRFRGEAPALAPPATQSEAGKRLHYDPLRATVILSVSASVIATASSFGLPVSTTYVAFAAVVATGAADRILQRGDAVLKLARTIWVVFSWFASAVIAAVATGIVCLTLFHLGTAGMVIALIANVLVRRLLKKRGDAQAERVREQARERRFPEEFTEYEA